MRRARAISAAWTAVVVACATLALVGIVLFMSQIHRAWWAPGGAGDGTATATRGNPTSSAAHDRGASKANAVPPASGPSGDTRIAAAEPEPVVPPPRDAEAGAGAGVDAAAARVPVAVVAALRERKLTIPVEGVSAAALVPSFEQARGERTHEALDIMAAAGTPVLAVEDGTIARLFTSKAGGLTIYQFDPSRVVAYYYAHLQRYAPGVEEGAAVRRGQVIGYVGATGNADPDAPHLHFAIFRLGPERRWWEGTAIDPYEVLR